MSSSSAAATTSTQLPSAVHDDEFDIYIEVPDLDDTELLPGLVVELTELSSAAPRLKIGSVVFAGKFQDIIGTSVAVRAVDDASAPVEIVGIAHKRIVFELQSGFVGDITKGLEGEG
jgi:hypothetical protein